MRHGGPGSRGTGTRNSLGTVCGQVPQTIELSSCLDAMIQSERCTDGETEAQRDAGSITCRLRQQTCVLQGPCPEKARQPPGETPCRAGYSSLSHGSGRGACRRQYRQLWEQEGCMCVYMCVHMCACSCVTPEVTRGRSTRLAGGCGSRSSPTRRPHSPGPAKELGDSTVVAGTQKPVGAGGRRLDCGTSRLSRGCPWPTSPAAPGRRQTARPCSGCARSTRGRAWRGQAWCPGAQSISVCSLPLPRGSVPPLPLPLQVARKFNVVMPVGFESRERLSSLGPPAAPPAPFLLRHALRPPTRAHAVRVSDRSPHPGTQPAPRVWPPGRVGSHS